MRTVILLTALCRLHPLRASWGRRHLVSLSWAQADGSRKTGLSPLSFPSFLGPAFQVGASLNTHQSGPGCQSWGRGAAGPHQVPLSCLVFPDTKPYGALDLEAPGKLPATTWEKGKGSEVSVMLTVSAAAAKVCPGDASEAWWMLIRGRSLQLVWINTVIQNCVLRLCCV